MTSPNEETRKLPRIRVTKSNVIFLVLALACFAGAAYNIKNVMSQFLNHPTATRITTVTKTSVKLPEVAICPFMPLNYTHLNELGIPELAIQFMHWHFTQETWELFGHYGWQAIGNWRMEKVSNYIQGRRWDKFIAENGIQCRGFLTACTFERTVFDCCEYAEPIMNEKRGLCHIFRRLPHPHTQHWPGPNNGLVILIKIPDITEDTNDAIIETGVELNYANKIRPPFTTNELGARSVAYAPPDTSTMVDVRLSEFIRSSAKQECTNGTPMCRVGCFNGFVEQFCNCSLLGLATTTTYQTCNPIMVYHCFARHMDQLNSMTPPCERKHCLPLCKEWKYQAVVSYADLERDHVTAMIGDQEDGGSYSLIRLFFSTLRYVKMEEFNLITFDNVLSQIGGISGIWLGVSMLSTAHAAMHIYRAYQGGRTSDLASTE